MYRPFEKSEHYFEKKFVAALKFEIYLNSIQIGPNIPNPVAYRPQSQGQPVLLGNEGSWG